MKTGKLLTFRWCGQEYGIAIEDVQGISNCSLNTCQHISWGVEELHQKGEYSLHSDVHKKVLLVNIGGMQLALLIDEILAVVSVNLETLHETRIANLQLWNLANKKHFSHKDPNLKEELL